MWWLCCATVNTYCLFRKQGDTRREAARKIYTTLDELLTLLCALAVLESKE